MDFSKRIKELGLDKSHDYHRQEVRHQLWLMAVVIEKNDLSECSMENVFYAQFGERLRNLRRSVLIWEQDDESAKCTVLAIIDEMLNIWEMDVSL